MEDNSMIRSASEQKERQTKPMIGELMEIYKRARNQMRVENFDEAYRLFRNGYTHGDALCGYGVAFCLLHGSGVEKNVDEANDVFAQSFAPILAMARQGVPQAQTIVGWYYANGYCGLSNKTAPLEWFVKAAEQGESDAQLELGNCYRLGDGVEKNAELAASWYVKAAEQGNPWAQYRLALCYKNGTGVPLSDERSAEWHAKAADQGFELSQFHLACCYQAGRGVEQSTRMATYWFAKAADKGDPMAQRALAKLSLKQDEVCEDEDFSVPFGEVDEERIESDIDEEAMRRFVELLNDGPIECKW